MRLKPVPSFETVTATPGTTAEDWSVILPEIVPVVFCAAVLTDIARNAVASRRNVRIKSLIWGFINFLLFLSADCLSGKK
ncbi:MAG: hypothetical protein ACREBD_03655 [Blastocatellia bacterium]